jgi:hypothetical protein
VDLWNIRGLYVASTKVIVIVVSGYYSILSDRQLNTVLPFSLITLRCHIGRRWIRSMPLNGALRSRAGDDRDRGHWYPKGGMFFLWTVTDLIVTRLLGGRNNINPIVSFYLEGWAHEVC